MNVLRKIEVKSCKMRINLMCIFVIVILFLNGCTTNLPSKGLDDGTKDLIYPDDFMLLDSEIPEGIKLKEIENNSGFMTDTQTDGFNGGPRTVTVAEQYAILYRDADPATIESVYRYVFVGVDGRPGEEMGIYIIKYKSEQDLENEILKISPFSHTAVFLYSNDVLVMIWSDVTKFNDEVMFIRDKLKERLGLDEINS